MLENPTARFFHHASRAPESPALACEDRSWSYRELARGASNVARQVQALSRKLGRPARVALFARKSVDAYLGVLGTLAGGGTYVPIHPKHPERAIRAAVNLAQPDAAIGAPPFLDMSLAALDVRGAEAWEAPAALPPDHPVYILFTSGTTGVPKGVVIPARALAAFQSELRSLYSFTPEDRFSQFVELTFDVSLFELWGAWDSGASLHVLSDAWAAAPDRFIRERALTVWTSTPSLISVLRHSSRLSPDALPSLRTSIFCGEPLTSADVEAWRSAAPRSIIDNHYGPTEATVACSWYRVPTAKASTAGRDTLSIGRPYSTAQLAVLSPTGDFLPSGETGELAISGEQVALGYLGAESDRFRWLEHPTLGRGRWYVTGDQGLCDAEGNFHVLGRLDLQTKVLGHRTELEAIEAAIREELEQVWAIAVPWPIEGGRASGLVAFVAGPVASDWQRRLESRLPRAVVPTRLIPLETPPRTAHGKLDRTALTALLSEEAPAVQRSHTGPSPTEQWLTSLWSEVLGRAAIPLDRTFQETGGDSASAIRVMAAIWDEFGEDLSPDDFRHDPTITGMARVLDAHRRSRT